MLAFGALRNSAQPGAKRWLVVTGSKLAGDVSGAWCSRRTPVDERSSRWSSLERRAEANVGLGAQSGRLPLVIPPE
ncbi:MAG: hypothetical protein QM784_35840 [Polyangiaceae bacterium]